MQPQRAEAEIPTPAAPPAAIREPQAAGDWSLPKRIGFRFLFSYFVLFFLTGQEIERIPFSGFLVQKYTELWHTAAVWIGKNLFHIRYEIVLFGDGSGDTTFRWILLPCYLVLAGAVTLLWSALDRRRREYERLNQWFHLLLRFSLALAMITYGLSKVIPNQMPYPRPYTLQQRVGELTPMRLLWTFMGASPAYERFTGLAELLGGVLLLLPWTTLAGALVCAADMATVFMLNLCYDVPVKIMSFHYLLMSVILIAPDLPRLANLLVFNRTAEPRRAPPLFPRRRLDGAVQVLFFSFGLFIVGMDLHAGRQLYGERNPPRPSFYGAWSVEQFAVDGAEVPPDTDANRWRWVAFPKPGALSIERAIGTYSGYALDLDGRRKIMRLGKHQRDSEGNIVRDAAGKPRLEPSWRSELSSVTPEPGVLILDGQFDGHRTHAKLRQAALLGTGFHWIIDPPKE